jgi:RNA polymerase sigma-70 factor (ECF subfamily)
MTPEFAPPDPLPQLSAERQEEFVLLLNGAHGLLLRYLMSLVANRHDAEDVLQRASLVMWRRFSTFESGTDFIAWATTVAPSSTALPSRIKAKTKPRSSNSP